MKKIINVTRSSMPTLDEYVEEIKELWDSHILTNSGIKHQTLEGLLKRKLNVQNVVLYTNGHLALEGIWDALNFPSGSEVITTPFTFCSTVHAIFRKGLIPVFCDIDPKSFCIDPSKIEKLITEKTVAICGVHVYGNMCDVEAIEQIAKKYGLKTVYDAAHAFAVTYKGLSSASYGDLTMFSFHATKVFNTIEGGAVCCKDKELAQKLVDYRNFGIHNPESIPYVGGNSKMNEFQAAMGICNLKHLEGEIFKRKKVALRYRKNLKGINGIILCEPQVDVISNFAYYPVVFDGFKKSRDLVYEQLKERGITARKYFYPLVNEMQCYAALPTADSSKTPIAKHLADRVLTLPLYSDLELEDVDAICNIILE